MKAAADLQILGPQTLGPQILGPQTFQLTAKTGTQPGDLQPTAKLFNGSRPLLRRRPGPFQNLPLIPAVHVPATRVSGRRYQSTAEADHHIPQKIFMHGVISIAPN
jgi:hypothetical protein